MKELNWKNWPFKNTTFLVLSVILFFYFLESPQIQTFIKNIGDLGYLGTFVCGIMTVSIFTAVPASAIIFDTARYLDPIWIIFWAGIGSVIGDYFIFKFLKNRVFEEISQIYKATTNRRKRSVIKKLFSTPFFSWLLPITGALLIMLPLPDEVGVGLLGLSNIKVWQFVLMTFVLNSIGFFFLVLLARAI